MKFLKKMDSIEFDLVENGQLAWDLYKLKGQGYYHIVILDQSMPIMDGDQVCEKIREIDSNQIVVSISANVFRPGSQSNKPNVNEHLSKPFTFLQFSSMVYKWLISNN